MAAATVVEYIAGFPPEVADIASSSSIDNPAEHVANHCSDGRGNLPAMSTLDHVDLELLAALATDHRATVVALAERLGLSRNTVQARMARLERSGVFLSYERAISSTALGFPIEAFISVTVRQADLPAITAELARVPEIVQAHGLSGQVDLLVRVACRDAQHLFDTDARILAIEGVERTETSLVMGEVIGYRVSPLMELARRE